MALGTTIDLQSAARAADDTRDIRPSQHVCGWTTVVAAGGMDDAVGSHINNPTTQLTAAENAIFRVKSGTMIRARLGYPTAASAAAANPVVQLFGRVHSSDAAGQSALQSWQLLTNRSGDDEVTITPDFTNDVRDGTFKYTAPDGFAHTWDMDGCDEFIFGNMTALGALTGASATGAFLQAKAI